MQRLPMGQGVQAEEPSTEYQPLAQLVELFPSQDLPAGHLIGSG